MSVNAVAASGPSPFGKLDSNVGAPAGLNRRVQSVFSEVLEAAGRAGYASAPARASDEPLEASVLNAWSDWMGAERTGRYAEAVSPEELKQGFGEILVRAHQDGGYLDPKTFLAGLSQSELKTVQTVQALAEPIDVDSLTEEGAINLLLPPVAQVDINRDGLTQSGVGYGIRFPDSNTPADVAEAWTEATAGMSFGERMTYELQMMTPLLTANLVVDDAGRFVRSYEPGDPGFTNPMASDDYSYAKVVRDQLASLDFMKEQMLSDRYEQQKEFWERLQAGLEERGVT